MAEDFEMTDCPLCGGQAKRFPTSGDHHKYDCPTDKVSDITGTAEQELRNNPDLRQPHRDRLARERKRGIKVPRVGG